MKGPKSTGRPERRLTVAGLALFAIPLMLFPEGPTRDEVGQQGRANRYIGAARCKSCHQAEESGNQFGVWEGEKHSEAYEVLASDSAKMYAQARGIADAQESAECLKCHDTAFGKPEAELHRSFKPNLGVQCESCHGPGENHLRARMAAAAMEEVAPEYTQIAKDEIVSDPGMETCLTCHNEESPGFKPFCFHKSAADIRHLNPLRSRTDEQRAALLVCGCGETCGCVNGCEDGKCGVPPPPKK